MNDNPLSVIYEGKTYSDGSNIHLGKILASVYENEDTKTYKFRLANSGPKTLTDFQEITNMTQEMYEVNFPEEIPPLGNGEMTLKLRGSKLFKSTADKLSFEIVFAESKKF